MKKSHSARFGEEQSKEREKQLQRLRGGKELGILEELEGQKGEADDCKVVSTGEERWLK